MDILEKLREENRSALHPALERITRYAEGHAEKKHILFGSAARGRWDALTDLDLLCYRPDEMAAMSERPLFRQIQREGKVLYEKQLV